MTGRLTVARMTDGSPLTPLQRVYLNRVLDHHGSPNWNYLIYACLECGSVGEIETKSRDDRDETVNALGRYTFSCCADDKTVVFQSERT